MPLNTLRLNHAPSSHPNDRIVFIKPLPRPASEQKDYETADLLLRAIAAQCLPVMKSNYLSVTTLEEHEPNPEFIGRNFNNGEIIQLVLRSKSGSWLSVRMIQMVMMHELAHNEQMNHSRKFWEVRNRFADEMRALWSRGYTGDGLWGSGRVLGDLDGVMRQGNGVIGSEELKDLPLCGGTFRSRGRRRKRKTDDSAQQLTWKEKKERRIEKKFGKNGVALGEDEDRRLLLEGLGKGPIGVKPRVAQSKRGRELRAAAALARFDTNKKEVNDLNDVKQEVRDEDDDDEDEEYEEVDEGLQDARDVHGNKLLDRSGCAMVKVCEDEDGDDVAVKQEMDELEELDLHNIQHTQSIESNTTTHNASDASIKKIQQAPADYKAPTPVPKPSLPTSAPTSIDPAAELNSKSTIPATTPSTKAATCLICTTDNPVSAVVCTTCSHVLDKCKDPRHWHCKSETCIKSGSQYVNAGDCGICGLCGTRKTT